MQSEMPTRIWWSVVKPQPEPPKPKYKVGTIFYREKFVHKDGYLVKAYITRAEYFHGKDGGWYYTAVATEPVEGIDNYWNISSGFGCGTTDVELDKFYGNSRPNVNTKMFLKYSARNVYWHLRFLWMKFSFNAIWEVKRFFKIKKQDTTTK